MRYDDEDDVSSGAAYLFTKQVFEERETTGKRRAKLVRDCHLVVHDRLVSALLLEHFGLKLHRLHVVGHVIKVDCGGLLLQKIDALDPNLRKLLVAWFKRLLNLRLFSVKPAPG